MALIASSERKVLHSPARTAATYCSSGISMMADLTRTFKVAGRGSGNRPADQSHEERSHNRPFQCASRMRPATGAASAPPDRACSITVTTAAIREACEPGQVHAGGCSDAARLSGDLQPGTCARCAVPNSTASAIPASTAGAAREIRRQYARASDAGVTSTPSSPSDCNGGRRVPYAAGAFAFAEPVGARYQAPSLHLGRQFAGTKSRRIVSHETVARIRDRRAHGRRARAAADASRRRIDPRDAGLRDRESYRRRAIARARAAR